jgi:hypothetical protein
VTASLGIAGVNTRPLMHASAPSRPKLAIAGNWGSTLRPHVDRVVTPVPALHRARVADRAGAIAWERACYLLDYTYLVCPDRETKVMRYRPGFGALCAPETRKLPLYLDSAAFREFMRTAPRWSGYERYCEAIDLTRPDGAMAKDVVGNQAASLAGYERMCTDGYREVAIPVWQVMPEWIECLSVEQNARHATRDPILRAYCARASLVAVGGLNQSPVRRGERHRYLEVLCQAFPDTQFWGLGQANPAVVNGLGMAGLLDRVSVDGSWWIHDARAEVLAVLEDGLVKTIKLTRTGAQSFFPLLHLMTSNLTSLLSAYAGLWTFPAPERVPTNLDDPEARLELRNRLGLLQLPLDFGAAGTASGEAAG